MTIFDPESLNEITTDLSYQLPDCASGTFKAVGQELAAVDGSVVDTVVCVARLAWLPKANGQSLSAYRLHTHFEVLRGVPTRISATPTNPWGAMSRPVLQRTIKPYRCYVTDRDYAKFQLFNTIVAAESGYVCRLRDNSAYEVEQQTSLPDADRASGVPSDEIVLLDTSRKVGERPDHPLQIVTAAASPHTSRGEYRGVCTGSS